MEFKVHRFPNPGFLTYELTEHQMNFLWKRVEKSKSSKKVNEKLAGNISESFDMGLDGLEPMYEMLIPLCDEYEKQFGRPYFEHISGKATYTLELSDWWVNYQYQNEFNPLHNHSGIYSWVIWMKIPTEFKDQSKLPIAFNSSSKDNISNFNFTFPNSLGEIVDYKIEMGKATEGTLAFFPSQLKHAVYPFYNCDEPRISIAGNISLFSKHLDKE